MRTAPSQKLYYVAAALVGHGQVYGLFVRLIRILALKLCVGPLTIVSAHAKAE